MLLRLTRGHAQQLLQLHRPRAGIRIGLSAWAVRQNPLLDSTGNIGESSREMAVGLGWIAVPLVQS